MEHDHRKKMIAPVIVTVLFMACLLIYGVLVAGAAAFSPVMLIFAIPLIALATAMICVLRDRIQEIKRGEEDDLSNY